MSVSFRHLALVVPDLRVAEEYYQSVFDMELIGREAKTGDGLWHTLPRDKGWDEAEAAGVELGMLALRKGQLVLALFKGDAPPGQVAVIGLRMPVEEMDGVRTRLPEDTQVSKSAPDHFEFCDAYQIVWQISLPESEFRTSGDIENRWLQI